MTYTISLLGIGLKIVCLILVYKLFYYIIVLLQGEFANFKSEYYSLTFYKTGVIFSLSFKVITECPSINDFIVYLFLIFFNLYS